MEDFRFRTHENLRMSLFSSKMTTLGLELTIWLNKWFGRRLIYVCGSCKTFGLDELLFNRDKYANT